MLFPMELHFLLEAGQQVILVMEICQEEDHITTPPLL